MNHHLDTIQIIVHPVHKMIGGITLALIILMGTKAKIQHISIIILILIMYLTLMNTNLIAIINNNHKMDMNIQTVIITFNLVKLTLLKLPIMILQQLMLMLPSINTTLLITIIMMFLNSKEHHQLKI